MNKVFLVIIFIAFFLVGCSSSTSPSPSPQPSSTPESVITFRVIDGSSNKPIANADIQLIIGGKNILLMSDGTGFANYRTSSEIEVSVIASAPGYEGIMQTITLSPGSSPSPIKLYPSTNTVLPTVMPSQVATEVPAVEPSKTTTLPTPTLPSTQEKEAMWGGQIAFVSERTTKEDGLPIPQIFIMAEDGEKDALIQVTDISDGACQPAWSPDGHQLLFVSPCSVRTHNRADITYSNTSLWLINIGSDGKPIGSKVLLISPSGGAFEPDWSQPGILFTSGTNNHHIFYSPYPPDNSGIPSQISTSTSRNDRYACWSSTGKFIVFSRRGRLYYGNHNANAPMDGDLGAPELTGQEITADGIDALQPACASLGNTIAFSYATSNDTWHIGVTSWDPNNKNSSRELVPLTSGGLLNFEPSWSPDNKWIVFTHLDGVKVAKFDVYKMSKSGGTLTQLTTHPAHDYQPAWRPNP